MGRLGLLVIAILICAILGCVARQVEGNRSSEKALNASFEVINGSKVLTCNGSVYVFGSDDNPWIRKVGGWNVSLRGVRINEAVGCFRDGIYSGWVEIARISEGKIEWIKYIVVKRVGYEGRDRAKAVYYNDTLNAFEIANDGKHVYINTREGIVKTDWELNVMWAAEIPGGVTCIAVSDGVYAARWNRVVKLSKSGKLEWAESIESEVETGIPYGKFNEMGRYEIDVHSIHAGKYVYLTGLAYDRSGNGVYPFLAKLDSGGGILWAERINVSVTPVVVRNGRIMSTADTFLAWVAGYLISFDSGGNVSAVFKLPDGVRDVAVAKGKVLLAIPGCNHPKKVRKVANVTATSMSVKAVKQEFEVRRVECHSVSMMSGELAEASKFTKPSRVVRSCSCE